MIYAITDSIFRRDVFGGVVGEHVVFAAVDATKGKDLPSGLSGLHRKTPDGTDAQKPYRSCFWKAMFEQKQQANQFQMMADLITRIIHFGPR